MLIPVVVAVLAAAPATLKVAMPGLHAVDVPADRASFYGEQLATELITRGMRVVTEREITTLLGLERQRELLGCAEGSCLVELANALGVDAVLLGQVAKVGTHFTISLRLSRASDVAPLGVATFKAASEEELIDWLARAATLLADQAAGRVSTTSAPAATTVGLLPVSRKMWWVPAIATGVFAAVGASFFVLGRSDYGQLDPNTPGHLTIAEATQVSMHGKVMQGAAVSFWIAAAAAAVASLAIASFGERPVVGAVLVPGGGGVSLAGNWP